MSRPLPFDSLGSAHDRGSTDRVPELLDRIRGVQPSLWGVAFAFFGVGDVVTTGFGLQFLPVQEAGPLTAVLIDQYGLSAMVAMKVWVLGGAYAVWAVSPRDCRVGVPLGLAMVGVVVVLWNLLIQVLAIAS